MDGWFRALSSLLYRSTPLWNETSGRKRFWKFAVRQLLRSPPLLCRVLHTSLQGNPRFYSPTELININEERKLNNFEGRETMREWKQFSGDSGVATMWRSKRWNIYDKNLVQARLGVSRTIYVNVDSRNLGFTYFNFLGGGQSKKTPCITQVTTIPGTDTTSLGI